MEQGRYQEPEQPLIRWYPQGGFQRLAADLGQTVCRSVDEEFRQAVGVLPQSG